MSTAKFTLNLQGSGYWGSELLSGSGNVKPRTLGMTKVQNIPALYLTIEAWAKAKNHSSDIQRQKWRKTRWSCSTTLDGLMAGSSILLGSAWVA